MANVTVEVVIRVDPESLRQIAGMLSAVLALPARQSGNGAALTPREEARPPYGSRTVLTTGRRQEGDPSQRTPSFGTEQGSGRVARAVDADAAARRALLEDPEWLRARYEDDELSTAEIGRMCGVHAQTVSKRLKAAGIQVQRGRHRSPAPDADPPDEDPPEGQAD